VFYGDLADIAVMYEKGDNIFVEGTLQTRQFTPKDGSTRTVHEIVARSAHQISKPKASKEAPADNDPQAQNSSIEPGVPAEVEADVEIWPS
jgi:single-strand DNA-binding protein